MKGSTCALPFAGKERAHRTANKPTPYLHMNNPRIEESHGACGTVAIHKNLGLGIETLWFRTYLSARRLVNPKKGKLPAARHQKSMALHMTDRDKNGTGELCSRPLCFASFRSLWTDLPSRRVSTMHSSTSDHSASVHRPSNPAENRIALVCIGSPGGV
jgi:hypothetical protein